MDDLRAAHAVEIGELKSKHAQEREAWERDKRSLLRALEYATAAHARAGCARRPRDGRAIEQTRGNDSPLGV